MLLLLVHQDSRHRRAFCISRRRSHERNGRTARGRRRGLGELVSNREPRIGPRNSAKYYTVQYNYSIRTKKRSSADEKYTCGFHTEWIVFVTTVSTVSTVSIYRSTYRSTYPSTCHPGQAGRDLPYAVVRNAILYVYNACISHETTVMCS